MSTEKCGTYAGYQAHIRMSEEPCDRCREANADYNRERRRSSAAVRQREMQLDIARRRAWKRLADMYPAQYHGLYEEETARIAPLPHRVRRERSA